jgi:hypothetical protein
MAEGTGFVILNLSSKGQRREIAAPSVLAGSSNKLHLKKGAGGTPQQKHSVKPKVEDFEIRFSSV